MLGNDALHTVALGSWGAHGVDAVVETDRMLAADPASYLLAGPSSVDLPGAQLALELHLLSVHRDLVLGHVYALSGQLQKAVNVVSGVRGGGSVAEVYATLRSAAISAYALRMLGQAEQASSQVLAALDATRLPLFTSIGGRQWLAVALDQYVAAKPATVFAELDSVASTRLLVVAGAWAVTKAASLEFSQAYSARIARLPEEIGTKHRFPAASQLNDDVEQLVVAVQFLWLVGVCPAKVYYATAVAALHVTYQSPVVMGCLVELLLALGQWLEMAAAFDTYVSYVATAERLGHSIDGMRVVLVYSQALQLVVAHPECVPEASRRLDLGAHLEQLRRHIELVAPGLDSCLVSHSDAGAAYEQALGATQSPLQQQVALARHAMASVFKYLAQTSATVDELHGYLVSTAQSLQLCVLLAPTEGEDVLAYAQVLVKLGHDDAVPRMLKAYVRHNPTSIAAWHMLALSYSCTAAEAPAAAKMASRALGLAELLLEEEEVSSATREQMLQLKMTQVAIVEMVDGIVPAVELLPEVFALFAKLFPGGASSNGTGTGNAPPQLPQRESRFVTQSKNALRRIATHTLHQRTQHSRTTSAVTETPTVEFVALLSRTKLLLAQVWLWAAKLYMRAQLVEDAEMAVDEAAALGARVEAARGLLQLVQGNRVKAVEHFRQGWHLEPSAAPDVECVLGMCYAVGGDVESMPVRDLEELQGVEQELYVDVTDRATLYAQLKLALEELASDYRHCNNSEVWWNLGDMYCRIDDKVLYHQAMQRCMELEQRRPARDYSVAV